MKVKYKKGVSNFGFSGEEYPADKDGYAELPADALAAAIEHSVLAPADEQPETEAELSEADKEWLEFLGQNVPDIKEALPGLTDDQLVAVHDYESVGQQRKGVLEAVAALQESRKV